MWSFKHLIANPYINDLDRTYQHSFRFFSDQQVMGWGKKEWEKARAEGAVSEEEYQSAVERGDAKPNDGARLFVINCVSLIYCDRRFSLQGAILEVSARANLFFS